MRPAIALGRPDDFVRRGEVTPIHAAIARFELGGDGFFEHVANGACRGVGDSQLLVLVVARGGDEGELRCVGTPFNVGPFAAAAGDVVTKSGAVLVGRKLQANYFGTVEIDDHALDGGD